VVIKLNVPLDISKTTYYRVIHYGLFVFPKYFKAYTLEKSHAQLILTFNEIKSLEISQVEEQIEESKQIFVFILQLLLLATSIFFNDIKKIQSSLSRL
jgi:hypothetical protein